MWCEIDPKAGEEVEEVKEVVEAVLEEMVSEVETPDNANRTEEILYAAKEFLEEAVAEDVRKDLEEGNKSDLVEMDLTLKINENKGLTFVKLDILFLVNKKALQLQKSAHCIQSALLKYV